MLLEYLVEPLMSNLRAASANGFENEGVESKEIQMQWRRFPRNGISIPQLPGQGRKTNPHATSTTPAQRL